MRINNSHAHKQTISLIVPLIPLLHITGLSCLSRVEVAPWAMILLISSDPKSNLHRVLVQLLTLTLSKQAVATASLSGDADQGTDLLMQVS